MLYWGSSILVVVVVVVSLGSVVVTDYCPEMMFSLEFKEFCVNYPVMKTVGNDISN